MYFLENGKTTLLPFIKIYRYKIKLNNFVSFLESLKKFAARGTISNIILLTKVIFLLIRTQGHTSKTSIVCEVLLNGEIKRVVE